VTPPKRKGGLASSGTSDLFPELPTIQPEELDSGLRYEIDEDGLLREVVGPWARDKHALVARYIDISRGVRKRWIGVGKAGASYVDLYCGPGRARDRKNGEIMHGSCLVAWNKSVTGGAPFSHVFVSDARDDLACAAEQRLKNANAKVIKRTGDASQTVDEVVAELNPAALHFAFLDPYNLRSLPFEIIRKLATKERMDILVHISLQDLNRNLLTYVDSDDSPLDSFTPAWRNHIDTSRSPETVKAHLFKYWRSLLGGINMSTAETAEVISGPQGQPLYWLALVARHHLALQFWEKIRRLKPVPQIGMFR
jgi:three-Cys-motif partner protein